MASTTAVKRATGLPESDQAENNRLMSKICSGWVCNSIGLGSNATAFSYGSAVVIVNGIMQVIATNTQAITGTIAASTTGAYVVFCGQAGTLRTAVHTAGSTVAAIALAQASANSELAVGIIKVACTATAFNGGTNSLADTSYTVTHINLVGPTGIAVATQLYSQVPG